MKTLQIMVHVPWGSRSTHVKTFYSNSQAFYLMGNVSIPSCGLHITKIWVTKEEDPAIYI